MNNDPSSARFDNNEPNRKYSSGAGKKRKWGFTTIKEFINTHKLTQTRKAIVLNDLIDASSPGIEFFILIIFSAAIATFGLISDQSVVTIGAQLIDPLMSPILGLALASLSGLNRMFRRSFIAVVKGAGLAILLSTALSFLFHRLPYGIDAVVPQQVLLRTAASPLDLGIAFVGGAAAAFALSHPRMDATMPGVAIATAIMPPLCTIGYGIAFSSKFIILGAILQFLTNFIAILFAAIITFAIMGFRDMNNDNKDDLSRSILVSTVMLLLIAIPLGILAWNSVSATRLHSQAKSVVIETLPESAGAELVDLTIQSLGEEMEITVTTRIARSLSIQEIGDVEDALTDALDREIRLQFVALPMQIVK